MCTPLSLFLSLSHTHICIHTHTHHMCIFKNRRVYHLYYCFIICLFHLMHQEQPNTTSIIHLHLSVQVIATWEKPSCIQPSGYVKPLTFKKCIITNALINKLIFKLMAAEYQDTKYSEQKNILAGFFYQSPMCPQRCFFRCALNL